MTGKVARSVSEKGFGFIKVDNGEDIFFHRSECNNMFEDLIIGDRVEFEMEYSPKGPRAAKVRIIEW
jgi:CspA family cold shock protein